MEQRQIPNNLNEYYLDRRAQLYALLWKIDEGLQALASGNVASYSLGSRSVSYNNIEQIKKLRDDTISEIEMVEALLSHRAPRNVSTYSFISPSISIPRE